MPHIDDDDDMGIPPHECQGAHCDCCDDDLIPEVPLEAQGTVRATVAPGKLPDPEWDY